MFVLVFISHMNSYINIRIYFYIGTFTYTFTYSSIYVCSNISNIYTTFI